MKRPDSCMSPSIAEDTDSDQTQSNLGLGELEELSNKWSRRRLC